MLYPKGEFDFQLTLFYKNQSYQTCHFQRQISNLILTILYFTFFIGITCPGSCPLACAPSCQWSCCSPFLPQPALSAPQPLPYGAVQDNPMVSNQPINQSTHRSINQSEDIFGLHICDLRKDYRGTPFIRQRCFYLFSYLLGYSFFHIILF